MDVIKSAHSRLASRTNTENATRALGLYTLENIKDALGLYDDDSQDDALGKRLMPAALGVVEEILDRPATLIARTDFYACFADRMALTERPSDGSVSSVVYLGSDGAENDVDANTYVVDADTDHPAVVFPLGAPDHDAYRFYDNPVRVTYEVGGPFRPAMKEAVAEAFRRACGDLLSMGSVSETARSDMKAMLEPYRRITV